MQQGEDVIGGFHRNALTPHIEEHADSASEGAVCEIGVNQVPLSQHRLRETGPQVGQKVRALQTSAA